MCSSDLKMPTDTSGWSPKKMAYIKVQKIISLLICTFPYGRKVTRIIIIACTKIAMEDYGSAMTKETSFGKPSEKFFQKNFRKNLEVTKKCLTFANAFPLKRELEKRQFFERL